MQVLAKSVLGARDIQNVPRLTVSRYSGPKIHQGTWYHLPILKGLEDAVPCDSFLNSRTTFICCQPPYHESTLMVIKPLGLLGKIGDKKEGSNGKNAGKSTLEYKDPAPGMIATNALHFADCTGQKPSESTGETSSIEEEGEAPLSFRRFVPHAH